MNHTVYLKLSQITELTHKDVVLKDVAQVYCDDQNVMNKCNSMKVMTVKVDAKRRYIMSALDVINKLKQLDSTIDVNNVGETDFIIAYKPPSPPAYIWQWTKTIFVCLVCFFGAAFAIMTFNNDVSVTDVFSEVFKLVMGYESGGSIMTFNNDVSVTDVFSEVFSLVMGYESGGFTVLEISYSVGLAVGIIGFFNHFAAIKLNTDPTPLEVEMRLYEDNISKTLIANDGRKESKIDIT